MQTFYERQKSQLIIPQGDSSRGKNWILVTWESTKETGIRDKGKRKQLQILGLGVASRELKGVRSRNSTLYRAQYSGERIPHSCRVGGARG